MRTHERVTFHTPSETTSGFEGLLAGRVLGDRYRIEAVIGRGGMGVVYRARDLRLDREVAVKVMVAPSHDPVSRAALRSRFHREARTIARLHHPNVVAVHDFGTDATLDLDYLVMELLRGEDLAARLARSGPPPLRLALQILCDAARGLAAGHQAGLVHRDVKPGNIFLEAGEDPGEVRVRLLDFGIVQMAEGAEDDESTQTHLTGFGYTPHSPAYAAPEQLQGLGCLTAACDVWALGAVAFHLLSGQRPFTDGDRQSMAQGRAVPLPSLRSRNPAVPPSVEQTVLRALAYRPADRFAHAGAFAAALMGKPVSATATASAGLTVSPDPDHTMLALPRVPVPLRVSSRLQAAAPPAPAHSFGSRLRAVIRGTVTSSVGAAVLAGWVLMGVMFRDGRAVEFYLLLGGMSFAAPWLVHRLVRQRGRLRAGLALSLLLTGFALYRTIPGEWPRTLLLLLPAAQIAAAALTERITRRAPRPVAVGS
jgi:serine/threonine protein kinase